MPEETPWDETQDEQMTLGLLLVAAPLALIFAVGAAVWLEGHVVDQPAEETLTSASDGPDASARAS
jgi:hypothetical protein